METVMPDEPKRPQNHKPLSLFPLDVEEALRLAMRPTGSDPVNPPEKQGSQVRPWSQKPTK